MPRKAMTTALALIAGAFVGMLDKTLKEYKTDPRRVYLTGLSMGGTGTWDFAVAEPNRWAAIVPICGRTNPKQAEKITKTPCWVFHGAADPIIPVTESQEMVAALQKAGGSPKYIEYPKAQHNCWDQAYATPDLWTWLAKQRADVELIARAGKRLHAAGRDGAEPGGHQVRFGLAASAAAGKLCIAGSEDIGIEWQTAAAVPAQMNNEPYSAASNFWIRWL